MCFHDRLFLLGELTGRYSQRPVGLGSGRVRDGCLDMLLALLIVSHNKPRKMRPLAVAMAGRRSTKQYSESTQACACCADSSAHKPRPYTRLVCVISKFK